jgi:transcriptional regulator with XRE-family HTH domain
VFLRLQQVGQLHNLQHNEQKNLMSYFSVALQRQAEQRKLNQSEIARRSGISRSFISRVMSGEAQEMSEQNFLAILKIFSGDPNAQAQLIAARCHDVRIGPGAELVEVRIKGAGEVIDEIPMAKVPLPLETERAFAWLRSQCPLNPELEKHLVGYAKLTGMR